MAKGISAINLGVVRGIFASWLITIPAGAILSIIFFFILKTIFG
jgi:PiT family inorganic phosphate transporter